MTGSDPSQALDSGVDVLGRPAAVADFRALPDLASRALGGTVMWCNDDFYADAHNLIKPTPAVHDPAEFDTRGKVYDGWETRRRRDLTSEPADVVILRLATPALVRGVNIDTAYFKGNYPPHASVEGTTILGYPDVARVRAADWITLVDKVDLEGHSANVFPTVSPPQLVTHLRLSIYPDGGVARFRVYGEAMPDPRSLGGRVDLAATVTGGRIAGCSNMFYSSPANVLAPGRATVMSDGWETARRRDNNNDWLTVQLAAPARLHHVFIDTGRFVGNSPGAARLSGVDSRVPGAEFSELLPRTGLVPDTDHRFSISDQPPVTHVRLDIYPDGGISRLRLVGEIDPAAREAIGRRWLSLLPEDQAATVRAEDFFG